jgi:CRP/FNR family transcriptional regulator, cyclic AMP receptor protein
VIDTIEMTSSAPDIAVADGEKVIVEGEATGALYVLVDGVLEVRRGDRPVVRMSEPGTIVGELGLLLDTVASADVVAVGECVVRRMDDAQRTFEQNPAFARHLATVLAHRLWEISTYLSDLKAQYADREDTLGLMPEVLQELLGGARPPADPGSDRETESPY